MTCATGYTGTASSISCLSSGAWTTSTGCTAVNCSTPTASTGYVLGSGATTYGSVYTMTCNTASGYVGAAVAITCQSSGAWTAQSGCSLASCPSTPLQANYVIASGASTVSSARTTTCATGYSNSGSSIACQASYLGCFVDSSSRDLPNLLSVAGGVTQESCRTAASAAGYLYFGLQNGNECWAGNTYGGQGAGTGCTTACTANAAQLCGGPWRNSVYSIARWVVFPCLCGNDFVCLDLSSFLCIIITLFCICSATWSAATGCSVVNCNMPTAPTGYALGSGSTTYGSLYSLTAAAGYQGVATQYISQTSSSRGLNVLVFTNSAQTSWTAYDTHGSTAASDSLATMLNGLANGVFVAIACYDSCAAAWTANLQTALTRIGGSIQSDTISGGTLSLRDQYILVAQVGTSSLTVQEEVRPSVLPVSVFINNNSGNSNNGISNSTLLMIIIVRIISTLSHYDLRAICS